jgi:hypothetical protein
MITVRFISKSISKQPNYLVSVGDDVAGLLEPVVLVALVVEGVSIGADEMGADRRRVALIFLRTTLDWSVLLACRRGADETTSSNSCKCGVMLGCAVFNDVFLPS